MYILLVSVFVAFTTGGGTSHSLTARFATYEACAQAAKAHAEAIRKMAKHSRVISSCNPSGHPPEETVVEEHGSHWVDPWPFLPPPAVYGPKKG